MQCEQTFPRLLSILYATFHPVHGPLVVHQVPDPAIETTFCDFDSVSDWLIPRRRLCNRLVSINRRGHRVVGYPICIVNSERYERNAFIFNLVFVFAEDADMAPYIRVVTQLAQLFRQLEEQSALLSEPRGTMLYNVMEQLLEDLNSFGECMIPIDPENTVNIKLFPILPNPPRLKLYHVPICTVQLELLMDLNWDLTLQQILPHIDGVKSVKWISEHADTDYELTRRCLEHLLYYGCMIVIDIFQFSNIYALTPQFKSLLTDKSITEELRAYVDVSEDDGEGLTVDGTVLIELYTRLTHGKRVKDWAEENKSMLVGIDIRRFITFGVIRGFVYRVHCYPSVSEPGVLDRRLPLVKYLGGTKHMDELCTEMGVSLAEAEQSLSAYGIVHYIYR